MCFSIFKPPDTRLTLNPDAKISDVSQIPALQQTLTKYIKNRLIDYYTSINTQLYPNTFSGITQSSLPLPNAPQGMFNLFLPIELCSNFAALLENDNTTSLSSTLKTIIPNSVQPNITVNKDFSDYDSNNPPIGFIVGPSTKMVPLNNKKPIIYNFLRTENTEQNKVLYYLAVNSPEYFRNDISLPVGVYTTDPLMFVFIDNAIRYASGTNKGFNILPYTPVSYNSPLLPYIANSSFPSNVPPQLSNSIDLLGTAVHCSKLINTSQAILHFIIPTLDPDKSLPHDTKYMVLATSLTVDENIPIYPNSPSNPSITGTYYSIDVNNVPQTQSSTTIQCNNTEYLIINTLPALPPYA